MDTQHSRKIETPADVAMGPDGQPGWIVIKTRFKNKYARSFGEVYEASKRLDDAIEESKRLDAAVKAGNMAEAEAALLRLSEAEVLELSKQASQATEFVWETYATLTLDWNWVDDETGLPLPKPGGNIGVFKTELYPEQTAWIREQIGVAQQYRATEGNVGSGDGSQAG